MSSSGYVVGRRAGVDGQPVGERHAVGAASVGRGAPFRAECGAKADVVDGDWPPEAAEHRACPVCYRDTAAPFA